jgi:hypothetical protein
MVSMPAYSQTGAPVLTPESIDILHNSLVFDGYGFGHFVEYLPGGIRAAAGYPIFTLFPRPGTA